MSQLTHCARFALISNCTCWHARYSATLARGLGSPSPLDDTRSLRSLATSLARSSASLTRSVKRLFHDIQPSAVTAEPPWPGDILLSRAGHSRFAPRHDQSR